MVEWGTEYHKDSDFAGAQAEPVGRIHSQISAGT